MVILSDLSEVLINGVNKVSEVIAKRYGEEAGARYAVRHKQTEEVFRDLLRGRLLEDRYFDIFLNDEEWPFDANYLMQTFSEEFKKVVPDTLDTYCRISAHPQSITDSTMDENPPKIIIVSDHINEHIVEIMCEHVDLFAMTYDQLWSCDVGMIKRDTGFFPYLLDLYDLDAAECIFIDDSDKNIEVAEAAGIKSIQFHDAYQLEAELVALGFEFYAW